MILWSLSHTVPAVSAPEVTETQIWLSFLSGCLTPDEPVIRPELLRPHVQNRGRNASATGCRVGMIRARAGHTPASVGTGTEVRGLQAESWNTGGA